MRVLRLLPLLLVAGCTSSSATIDGGQDGATVDGARLFDAGGDAAQALDGAVAEDLARTDDFARAPVDMTTLPDLTTRSDMTSLPARRIFIAPVHDGNFCGLQSVADMYCQTAADAARLGGTYRALLDFGQPGGYQGCGAVGQPGSSGGPLSYLVLTAGRKIVRVDGVQVATDDTFFTASHLAPINVQADGSGPNTTCVWTGFSSSGTSTTSNCSAHGIGGWATATVSYAATAGALNLATSWADGSGADCASFCHVYCLEQ